MQEYFDTLGPMQYRAAMDGDKITFTASVAGCVRGKAVTVKLVHETGFSYRLTRGALYSQHAPADFAALVLADGFVCTLAKYYTKQAPTDAEFSAWLDQRRAENRREYHD